MKIILTQLSSYHLWATNLLLERIDKLPEELKAQEVVSSFNSLNQTIYHIWNAEHIWWQRMRLQEMILPLDAEMNKSFGKLAGGWMAQAKQWHEWIITTQEHVFEHEFIYYNSKREKFKQKIYEMLIHLFNHGTYHRGQLVVILRQLEVGSIPQTDFIVWSRRRGIV